MAGERTNEDSGADEGRKRSSRVLRALGVGLLGLAIGAAAGALGALGVLAGAILAATAA